MGGIFDLDKKRLELCELEKKSSDSLIWSNPTFAKSVLQKQSQIKSDINSFEELHKELESLEEFYDLADEDMYSDLDEECNVLLGKVKLKHVECLFADDVDSCDCFLTIQSGVGGTDSNDWAGILLRMYTRWADLYKKYSVELIDEVKGEEVGIKSATIKISGRMCYGWTKTESGIHRLVRISPFNANAKRHTSFASILVSPIINDDIEVEIRDKDIRIDTYRASGAGGQHVNKTDSAVRITHIPTGIVVQCQNSRSQHRNKSEVLNVLRSRLYQLQIREREAKFTNTNKTDVGWGHQIRSYVMQPYQIVKDSRTGMQSGDIERVLDGDLDKFIIESLSINKQ